jgi:hypothetical protein
MNNLRPLLLAAALAFYSCSSDPLDQKYTVAEGMQPLLDKKIQPPIPEHDLLFIKDAEMTNNRNGIPNEGKTFNELLQQGVKLYAERKTTEIVDSIAYKVEVEQRAKAAKE